MIQHSQARSFPFVDLRARAILALGAALTVAFTLFGFASMSRAETDVRIVASYYDDGGQYAYEPEPDCVVEYAPPAPRAYAVPPSPYYGAIWVEPHWFWDGYRWVWVDGYYTAPRPGYVYVEPRWTFSYGVNVFVGGYFYPANTYVVGWNSYHHYWWHHPNHYHHYFANSRPYYYNDYRQGRYYYRDRSDSRRVYDERQRYGYHDNNSRHDDNGRARNDDWRRDGFEGRDNGRNDRRDVTRQPTPPQRQTQTHFESSGRGAAGMDSRDAGRSRAPDAGARQGSRSRGGGQR